MSEPREALERCLADGEYDTVARFRAHHRDGEFTIELGCHGSDPPVWNIAGEPPIKGVQFDDWTVYERKSGGTFQSPYILLDTDVEDADEALDELFAIASKLGATRVTTVKTFAGAENPLKDLRDVVRHRVIEPVRQLAGGRE